MSVVALGFSIIYSWEFLSRRTAKAILFAFLLVTINQIHIAVSLEFAGFAFHVLEESVEVVAGLFALFAVVRHPLKPTV